MTGFDVAASDALHARVRAFIDASMVGVACADAFDALAVELARWQAACGAGVDRLLALRGLSCSRLDRAADIPAVPTDVFKLRRVACHPPALDAVVFRTSGTTIGARGAHPVRTLATYQRAARAWGRRCLVPDIQHAHWLILAPPYHKANDSSLGFMLHDFAGQFGQGATWAVQDGRFEHDAVLRVAELAARHSCPVVIAGASFAFVHCIDALRGERVVLPPASRAMQTGGFKGKTREVDADALHAMIADAFGIPMSHVVGEYGMTELSSQAYDGTLRVAVGTDAPAALPGRYVAPPWMHVTAVDAVSLLPVPRGEVGIARIEDLANVDSAVAVQTADRIRVLSDGFELLGREPSATPRGCSLGVDEILGAS
ncbi:MAG: acyl-protein synthetase [Polyangiaceae bacterium]|jgi:hypothetical protein|nr:acyl-protein synthetase [Polyangiaceae bacterium]